jgi:phosphatidate phosphatase APP1
VPGKVEGRERRARRALIGAAVVAAAVAALATRATSPAGAAQVANIELYSGLISTARGGRLYGRVHKGRPLVRPTIGQSKLWRVVQTVQALETRALPGALLTVSGPGLGPASSKISADSHGFFTVWLPPGLPQGSLSVSVRLDDARYTAPEATLELPVWGPRPGGRAIISDIDDTLTDTGVTHKLQLVANTVLRSTWELRTFAGAPQAVAELAGPDGRGGSRRPVVYLSGSPWGLLDRIAFFFQRAGFPRGSMVLRRYSQEPIDAYKFKHPHLLEIVDALPDRQFILLGDSGEKDPEVYRTLMQERPGRVAAVYIHLVTDEPASSPRFAGFTAFREWPKMLDDARRRQMLPK